MQWMGKRHMRRGLLALSALLAHFFWRTIPVESWRPKVRHQDGQFCNVVCLFIEVLLVPGRSTVELHACAYKADRWRATASPSCSTSLKGSLTTRFSNRTHTSQGETLVTSPIAPAGIFTGGSSSHLSLTRCPTAKFPFFMALEPVIICNLPTIVSAISEGAKNESG
jgi:hypothetical protein